MSSLEAGLLPAIVPTITFEIKRSEATHKELNFHMTTLGRLFHGAALFVFLSVIVLAQTSPRGITPEDYYSFEFVSDPHISPDGKLVAYVVTKVDHAQNRRSSSIWMVATAGSRAPWHFTTSPRASNEPRWCPDGKSLPVHS